MRVIAKKSKGIRGFIARQLVNLAEWIRPKNEEGKAYFMNLIMESEMEAMKKGTSVIEMKVRKTEA